MKITKLGHCCLLIVMAGKRLLTDPGRLSDSQNQLENIDLILITHEHTDHLHTDSLVEIMKKNPTTQIICNGSVGKIVEGLGYKPVIVEGREATELSGMKIEAFDGDHATIFEDFGLVQNTGYFIADKLFFPGDAYTEPGRAVPVLALPVSGPWCKLGDVIAYLKTIKPEQAIPVHDGLLNEAGLNITYQIIEKTTPADGVKFRRLKAGETIEISIDQESPSIISPTTY